jgi:CRISPR-associated protein Csy2
MSTYITLNHVQIQNANCVNGLTFGFPAITHFLGYVHALSRKLERSHNIILGGCAVACHQHQIHAYQPKGFGEYTFALTRNPLTKGGKTAPIIEEGKMHLTVSLVIKCEGLILGGEEGINALQKHLEQLCLTQKLAGGVINSIRNIVIESANSDTEQATLTQKIRRRLLPGFLLFDRSQYLEKHLSALQEVNQNADMLDTWLDFSTLKFKAEASLDEGEELSNKTNAVWKYIPKPESGYLVPITTGYRAISEVYKAGEVGGVRDSKVPLCFVEAAYGLGEWQSPHRLQNIEDALWNYHDEEGWYLCISQTTIDIYEAEHEDDNFDFID